MILPDVGMGPYPVLMQLHGLSDDEDSWIERSNLVRYVGELPLIVVLPDGGASAYFNWRASDRLNHHRYEDLLIRDIPAHLTRHCSVNRGPWAIGGLSMGGYGAMRLGLKYPDRFTSIYACSSAFRVVEVKNDVDPALIPDIENANVYRHVDELAERDQRPVIAFDCGVADRPLEHTRSFHQYLQSRNIEHHYAEFDGGHE